MSRVTRHGADPGSTLADRLAHPAPMPPVEVASVGHQVATTLDTWHRAGHSHRALEPGAVELATAPGGRPLARLRPPTEAGPGAERYRAPEQRTGRPVGPAADVFSLGVVLLDALTGRHDTPPAVPDDIGSAWRYLLAGMTAVSPADRPTAGTVAHTLGQVPGVVAPPAPDPASGPADGAPRSKLLPGGAQVTPAPIELPKEHRLARLLPSVPGLRRPAREPDVRPRPEESA